MKRLILAAVSAVSIVAGASPAAADHVSHVPGRAQDDRACSYQAEPPASPSCRPDGFIWADNHNETLVCDA